MRYVVGSSRAKRWTPSGRTAKGIADPDRNIIGKNSRLAIAGAVRMSRAVLPTSSPIGTSAQAPHRYTATSVGQDPAMRAPKIAHASVINTTSEIRPVRIAVTP